MPIPLNVLYLCHFVILKESRKFCLVTFMFMGIRKPNQNWMIWTFSGIYGEEFCSLIKSCAHQLVRITTKFFFISCFLSTSMNWGHYSIFYRSCYQDFLFSSNSKTTGCPKKKFILGNQYNF